MRFTVVLNVGSLPPNMAAQRICIVGVGLLGGSVGLAAKSRLDGCVVAGWGHRPSTLAKARDIGAIDIAAPSLPQAVADASLVVLCTPVGAFETMLRAMAPALTPGTVVTDVGSTKRSVVRLAARLLPRGTHFVGSHPMAGSEKRGIDFARTDLFDGALCITTPAPATSAAALRTVERFWRALGMRICRLSPEQHDSLLADISHLPHAVAAALVAMQTDRAMKLAGKGFLDTTRIAGGDGRLWRDILLDNRDNLRNALNRLRQQLAALDELLHPARAEELAAWLDAAAQRRQHVLRQKLREVSPD